MKLIIEYFLPLMTKKHLILQQMYIDNFRNIHKSISRDTNMKYIYILNDMHKIKNSEKKCFAENISTH